MKKILCVVGTRPEAVKMAPLIIELKRNKNFDVRILATAQHRNMLDQVMHIFKLQPDIDLDIMQPNQLLPELTARLLIKISDVLTVEQPDVVLAQGDTTTVMTVAMACFYQKIPFGHVEAGLRTWDMLNPFPEEMNRVIAGRLAKWHFAPTTGSKNNLLQEGVREVDVIVTGNTVIDALLSVVNNQDAAINQIDDAKRTILVTAHRRENFGLPFENVCRALLVLLERNADLEIIFPVHPNPNIKRTAYDFLGSHSRVLLCEPLDYIPFIKAMQKSYIILTDSGGVQEEAPALAKPVLVLRDETERPEAVDEGVVKLIGTNIDIIVSEVQRLLDDPFAYKDMARGVSPYGDGKASQRISAVLNSHFFNE